MSEQFEHVRRRANESRESLEKIGDGDWTPQDTAHQRLVLTVQRLLDADGKEPREIYETCVAYLIANGWRRQELGSGWWWKVGCVEEATLGGALEEQLDADKIDQRNAIPGEPQEFWG